MKSREENDFYDLYVVEVKGGSESVKQAVFACHPAARVIAPVPGGRNLGKPAIEASGNHG